VKGFIQTVIEGVQPVSRPAKVAPTVPESSESEKTGKKNPSPVPPFNVNTYSSEKFADASPIFSGGGPEIAPACANTLKALTVSDTINGAEIKAFAAKRPSLQLAENVPTVVTPSHVALVLMVAADARPTANVRERRYLNIESS
jgi:hypothetical protein